MGLFGGFKAKFTKNSKKNNKDKSEEVVCLKYYVHSEFDNENGPVAVHTTVRSQNPRRQRQIKPKRPITEIEVHENNFSQSTSKSASLNNLNHSPLRPKLSLPHEYEEFDETDVPNVSKSRVETTRSLQFASNKSPNSPERNFNSLQQKKTEFNTTNHDDYEEVSPSEEHKELVKPYYKTENGEISYEPSTLILMTQHSSASDMADKYSGLSLQNSSFQEYDTAYEEDDFKVNVVTHEYHKSFSISEDELSDHEDLPGTDYTAMGYSSQASSIFFGGDMQPAVSRQRRMVLKDDDGASRRSSDADC